MNTTTSDEAKVQYVATCCSPLAGQRAIFWGSVLILLGAFGLLSILLPSQQLGRFVLPVFLLLWGGALVIGRRRA